MAEPIEGHGFVWSRSSSKEEAVSLLVNRFPFLLECGSSERDLVELGAFYAYGIFAKEIVARGDEGLLRGVAEFINYLARSNDSLLEELVRTELLGTIAQTPEIDQAVSRHLRAEALRMRQQIT